MRMSLLEEMHSRKEMCGVAQMEPKVLLLLASRYVGDSIGAFRFLLAEPTPGGNLIRDVSWPTQCSS